MDLSVSRLKRLSEAAELVGIQEPFPLSLRITVNLMAGIGALRSLAPLLSHGEHVRQESQAAVGVRGMRFPGRMKSNDVGLGKIFERQLSKRRENVKAEHSGVLFNRPRFFVRNCMVAQVAAGKVSQARCRWGASGLARIPASGYFPEEPLGLFSGQLDRPWGPEAPNGQKDLAAPNPGFKNKGDVPLAATGPEPTDILIPQGAP
jgi:hypothetical protein